MGRSPKNKSPWLIRISVLLILAAAIILGGATLLRAFWNLIWVCMGGFILIGLVFIFMFVTGIPGGILGMNRDSYRDEK